MSVVPFLLITIIVLVTFFAQLSSAAFLVTTAPNHQFIGHRLVDEIAPAVQNATAAAFDRANAILANYSDALRIVAIPTGLAFSFFGYFLLAPVLFVAGFISGGGLSFVAVCAILGKSTPVAAWISIASMLFGGAMVGFIALRALNIGMFAVGAALGVILASCFKTTLVTDIYPRDPELAFIISAVVLGVIFGLLAIYLQKQMLICSTAYAGSAAATFGLGHFAGHFPSTADLANAEAGHLNAWILFYVIIALSLGTLGMLFQFWLGRYKPMPQYAPRDRRRRAVRRVPEFDEWSDTDDEWENQVVVERVPFPRSRSKSSAIVVPKSQNSAPMVVQQSGSQNPAAVSARLAQRSWESQKRNEMGVDMESIASSEHHEGTAPLAVPALSSSPVTVADSYDIETKVGGKDGGELHTPSKFKKLSREYTINGQSSRTNEVVENRSFSNED